MASTSCINVQSAPAVGAKIWCLFVFMRPSSLGGGRILRRTLSVRPSVCLSVCPSVPLSSVTSRHLANYNDTHVLFATRWGPHIVRPSRPHKFLFYLSRPIRSAREFLFSSLGGATVFGKLRSNIPKSQKIGGKICAPHIWEIWRRNSTAIVWGPERRCAHIIIHFFRTSLLHSTDSNVNICTV